MIKSFLGSVAGAALLAGGAMAADLPVRSAAPAPMMVMASAYNWSGFYIGLNAGAAWTSGCTNYTLLNASNWPTTCVDNNDVQFTGGAQIGYNWQFGSGWVVGIEADLNALGNSNNSSRSFFYNGGLTAANGSFLVNGLGDPSLFGTLRARFGFAVDRALFYVTGGLAWADSGNDPSISWWAGNTSTALSPDLVWRRGGASGFGWTLGAGIEYAMSNNWTVRGEYLYVDLGKEDSNWSCAARIGTCPGLAFTGRSDVNFNVLRVGLNYKFGGGRSAVMARY